MEPETTNPTATPEESTAEPETGTDTAPDPEPAPAPENRDTGSSTPDSTQDAPESPSPDEVQALRAQLARANAMRTAAVEAAKLGVEPGHIPYVLRLMEMPDSGKDEDIAAAVQKVLDDVPAFKPAAQGGRPQMRIGAKDAEQSDQNEAIAKAFGNTPNTK